MSVSEVLSTSCLWPRNFARQTSVAREFLRVVAYMYNFQQWPHPKIVEDERSRTLPHQVKTQYLHFRFHANYFILPWKIPEEISRRSMLFHNSKAVSTISNIMNIQHFTTVVDWPEIWCLMEISSMSYICRYCVFTWGGKTKVVCQIVTKGLYMVRSNTVNIVLPWFLYFISSLECSRGWDKNNFHNHHNHRPSVFHRH